MSRTFLLAYLWAVDVWSLWVANRRNDERRRLTPLSPVGVTLVEDMRGIERATDLDCGAIAHSILFRYSKLNGQKSKLLHYLFKLWDHELTMTVESSSVSVIS